MKHRHARNKAAESALQHEIHERAIEIAVSIGQQSVKDALHKIARDLSPLEWSALQRQLREE